MNYRERGESVKRDGSEITGFKQKGRVYINGKDLNATKFYSHNQDPTYVTDKKEYFRSKKLINGLKI